MLPTKGLGAGTIEIGLVSEMHDFLICVKGIILMEKNDFFYWNCTKIVRATGLQRDTPLSIFAT